MLNKSPTTKPEDELEPDHQGAHDEKDQEWWNLRTVPEDSDDEVAAAPPIRAQPKVRTHINNDIVLELIRYQVTINNKTQKRPSSKTVTPTTSCPALKQN